MSSTTATPIPAAPANALNLEKRALNLGEKSLQASRNATEASKKAVEENKKSSQQRAKNSIEAVLGEIRLPKQPDSKTDSSGTASPSSSPSPSVIAQCPNKIEAYERPYGLFVMILVFAIGYFLSIEASAVIAGGADNWSEIRCQPHIIPLASLYGYDTNENLQFCLNNVIQDKSKGSVGPLAQGMSGFSGVLTNLMESANSFRTTLATMVGGIIRLISEFKARMEALMGRVKMTASRMKMLMYRVYGTMFSVVYMGMSAMTAVVNFTDTFVFGFLEIFCFPGEQGVVLEGGAKKQIKDVQIGEVLEGGHRVKSTYVFLGDGHEMVQIGLVIVSANHLIQHDGSWIYSKDHPDAVPMGRWTGGVSRPLICLSTDTHKIPIGPYMFTDYDETDEGDLATQTLVHTCLNGSKAVLDPDRLSYEIGSPESTRIFTLHGLRRLDEVVLGDILEKSKVIGIQRSITREYCTLPDGSHIAAGALVWNSSKEQWLRAHMLYPRHQYLVPKVFISLFLNPGSQYVLENGLVVRDAIEVNHKDTMKAYVDALL